MTPAAARPYLRYAAARPLRKARCQRSVAGWPFLASCAAARLVAGPKARMTCTTTPTAPRRASRRSREDDGPIVVTDDWPEQVPIGDAELRAIEGHMRQELDKLFGPLP